MAFLIKNIRRDQAVDMPEMLPYRLLFKDETWERRYKAAIREDNLSRVRLAFVLGIIMNSLFVPIDYLQYSQNQTGIAMARGLLTNGVMLLGLVLSYTEYFFRRWPGLLFIAAGVYTVFQAIANVVGGIDQPVNQSFVLAVFIIYSLFPLYFYQAVTIGVATTAIYLAITWIFGVDAGGVHDAIMGTALILSANVVGVFALRRIELLRREAFARSVMVEEERNKVRDLVNRILPATVAQRLRDGDTQMIERLPDVTVLFADVQDFTSMASACPPEQTIEVLSKVFDRFDELVEQHGVEKIKTVGDAYMVAAGAPPGTSAGTREIAELACEMMSVVQGIERPDGGGMLNIRIGIARGPLIAGVVGDSRFLYDLWGDPVNTASRMETTGEGGRIQVTAEVVDILKDEFEFEPRGEVEVKGKGRMKTWWLNGPQGGAVRSLAAG